MRIKEDRFVSLSEWNYAKWRWISNQLTFTLYNICIVWLLMSIYLIENSLVKCLINELTKPLFPGDPLLTSVRSKNKRKNHSETGNLDWKPKGMTCVVLCFHTVCFIGRVSSGSSRCLLSECWQEYLGRQLTKSVGDHHNVSHTEHRQV